MAHVRICILVDGDACRGVFDEHDQQCVSRSYRDKGEEVMSDQMKAARIVRQSYVEGCCHKNHWLVAGKDTFLINLQEIKKI